MNQHEPWKARLRITFSQMLFWWMRIWPPIIWKHNSDSAFGVALPYRWMTNGPCYEYRSVSLLTLPFFSFMISRVYTSILRTAAKLARLSSTACRSTMAPITLYSWPTPNGIKASITLEELGLQYKAEAVNISTNRQKEEYGLYICVIQNSLLIFEQVVLEN